MVALITTSSLRTPVPNGDSGLGPAPQLRLIRGGLHAPQHDRSALVVVAAVLAVFAAIIGLRLVQGQPPVSVAGSSALATNASSSAVAIADAGESQRIVMVGDTLWAIAEDLAPGRDPRPIVDALADRNGGSALRAGDILVIPAELLGTEQLDLVAAEVLE